MVEDRLNNSLANMGYLRVDSNAAGIYLFYHTEGNDLIIVSVINAINGNEITGEQYKHILNQIKTNFTNSNPQKIKLLSLILTRFPDRVKHLCTELEEDNHWIVDLYLNRLMIYETQSTEFPGLRETIELLLEEEQRSKSFDEGQVLKDNYAGAHNSDRMQSRVPNSRKIFTLLNTIIVAINIIAFLILHYSGAFGGDLQMLSDGALSWYLVKEENEYYRLLTSMFMHADWDHLINNMIVLLFVGDNLERAAGKIKYILIYFGTGIVAGIASIGYNMWKEYADLSIEQMSFSIGASGAIFGVVGAVLYIVIINRGRLEDISLRQIILFAVLSLYSGFLNVQIDVAAHIGGFVAGILFAAILYRRPKPKSAVV